MARARTSHRWSRRAWPGHPWQVPAVCGDRQQGHCPCRYEPVQTAGLHENELSGRTFFDQLVLTGSVAIADTKGHSRSGSMAAWLNGGSSMEARNTTSSPAPQRSRTIAEIS